jgi:hypothetical protein
LKAAESCRCLRLSGAGHEGQLQAPVTKHIPTIRLPVAFSPRRMNCITDPERQLIRDMARPIHYMPSKFGQRTVRPEREVLARDGAIKHRALPPDVCFPRWETRRLMGARNCRRIGRIIWAGQARRPSQLAGRPPLSSRVMFTRAAGTFQARDMSACFTYLERAALNDFEVSRCYVRKRKRMESSARDGFALGRRIQRLVIYRAEFWTRFTPIPYFGSSFLNGVQCALFDFDIMVPHQHQLTNGPPAVICHFCLDGLDQFQ